MNQDLNQPLPCLTPAELYPADTPFPTGFEYNDIHRRIY
jgi:hypothetical protein